MFVTSTRNQNMRLALSDAMYVGLASDGGLFVPEKFPQVDWQTFLAEENLPRFAEKVLHPFFVEDKLAPYLAEFCQHAFNFPIPLKELNPTTHLLELFHGPTLSFKDFGARFLAACMNQLAGKHKITVMVATSGDTGSAVASAFYEKSHAQLIILYPHQQISARQEHQIACWNKNVLALAVKGSFDDCQQLLKNAFKSPDWLRNMHLTSANSINIGRLLPQIIYYALSSVQYYAQYHTAPGYIIPTGNLGNATAAYWAKRMGFPIREIVLALNANRTILDYLETGTYQARPSIQTLANAMDIGNPSNFERLQYLFPSHADFKKNVRAISVSDEDIKQTIQRVYQHYNLIICPHTATAAFTREHLGKEPWIIVATADPAKFELMIEPLLHCKLPIPARLQTLLDQPLQRKLIESSLQAILPVVNDYFNKE